jgi:hypothetical protein
LDETTVKVVMIGMVVTVVTKKEGLVVPRKFIYIYGGPL